MDAPYIPLSSFSVPPRPRPQTTRLGIENDNYPKPKVATAYKPPIPVITTTQDEGMLGGYHYAFQQQQQQQGNNNNGLAALRYGREPEIEEACESYISDINTFERMLAPETAQDQVPDEANASYMGELNQRMDRALGNERVNQVLHEEARQQEFLKDIKRESAQSSLR